MPALAPSSRVNCATPGVGNGPSRPTFAPAATNPDSSAASNMYPETRVSLPINTSGRRPSPSTTPAARPSFSMNSAVIGHSPTRPRTPSVPKYLRGSDMLDIMHEIRGLKDTVQTQRPYQSSPNLCEPNGLGSAFTGA